MGFPITYAGLCKVFVNDFNLDILARNIILLLCAHSFTPDKAAEMMLHIWYSAVIPQPMLDMIREKVLPLISEVCRKIENGDCSARIISKTWTFGSATVRAVLAREHWKTLLLYFELPPSFSAARARDCRLSVTMNPSRTDYLERHLYNQIPAIRVCKMGFRKDGILLPFGASRMAFDTPNP